MLAFSSLMFLINKQGIDSFASYIREYFSYFVFCKLFNHLIFTNSNTF